MLEPIGQIKNMQKSSRATTTIKYDLIELFALNFSSNQTGQFVCSFSVRLDFFDLRQ
ncbi:MAG: hypothetical protein NZT61_03915 [Deltaproteobacteria bacterium]|nr:hypothetical protein [Deltaproteobacteria bacterium]